MTSLDQRIRDRLEAREAQTEEDGGFLTDSNEALRRILDLHQPAWGLEHTNATCPACATDPDMPEGMPWPCPTVRVIAQELSIPLDDTSPRTHPNRPVEDHSGGSTDTTSERVIGRTDPDGHPAPTGPVKPLDTSRTADWPAALAYFEEASITDEEFEDFKRRWKDAHNPPDLGGTRVEDIHVPTAAELGGITPDITPCADHLTQNIACQRPDGHRGEHESTAAGGHMHIQWAH